MAALLSGEIGNAITNPRERYEESARVANSVLNRTYADEPGRFGSPKGAWGQPLGTVGGTVTAYSGKNPQYSAVDSRVAAREASTHGSRSRAATGLAPATAAFRAGFANPTYDAKKVTSALFDPLSREGHRMRGAFNLSDSYVGKSNKGKEGYAGGYARGKAEKGVPGWEKTYTGSQMHFNSPFTAMVTNPWGAMGGFTYGDFGKGRTADNVVGVPGASQYEANGSLKHADPVEYAAALRDLPGTAALSVEDAGNAVNAASAGTWADPNQQSWGAEIDFGDPGGDDGGSGGGRDGGDGGGGGFSVGTGVDPYGGGSSGQAGSDGGFNSSGWGGDPYAGGGEGSGGMGTGGYAEQSGGDGGFNGGGWGGDPYAGGGGGGGSNAVGGSSSVDNSPDDRGGGSVSSGGGGAVSSGGGGGGWSSDPYGGGGGTSSGAISSADNSPDDRQEGGGGWSSDPWGGDSSPPESGGYGTIGPDFW